MTTTATAAAPEVEPTPPEQIEWDLGEIYPHVDAWNAARTALEKRVEALAGYQGRLGESAATLREVLDAVSAADKELSRLFVHAFLEADEDRRVAAAAGAPRPRRVPPVAVRRDRRVRLARAAAGRRRDHRALHRRGAGLGAARVQPARHPAARAAHPVGRVRAGHRGHRPRRAGPRAHLRPADQLGHGVPRRYPVHRRGGDPRPVRLHRAPGLAGARRPQARVRPVLGRVEDLRGDGRAASRHAGEGPRVPRPGAALRQLARGGAGRPQHPRRRLPYPARRRRPPPAVAAPLLPHPPAHARARRPALLRHLPAAGRARTASSASTSRRP